MHGDTVEIIVIVRINNLISIYFVFEGQITPPPPVVIGQVVNKRNAFLLVSGEPDHDNYDAVLATEEVFDKTCRFFIK